MASERGRGAQVKLDGAAQTLARGATGNRLVDNIIAKTALDASAVGYAGENADGSARDGTGAMDEVLSPDGIGGAGGGAVQSVAGRTGVVVLAAADVSGLSAAAAAAAPVQSVAGRSGAVALASTDLVDSTITGRSIVTAISGPAALGALGGATAGANSNITSLAGLTTPLAVAQGGTGLSTPPTISNRHIVGRWDGPAIAPYNIGYQPVIANRLYAVPFDVREAVTFDRIANLVNVAPAAAANIRLGLYADTGFNAPGALLLDSGAIAVAVGVATPFTAVATINYAVANARRLWLAYLADTALTVSVASLGRSILPGVSAASMLQGTATIPSGYRVVTQTYGALPTNPIWVSHDYTDYPPIGSLRTASLP